MGGLFPPQSLASSGPSGLVGLTFVQIFVSYAAGVFTVASNDARITVANFAHAGVGNWTLDLTNIAATKILGAWSNVVQDSALNKNFGSDVHLVPTGGPALNIYILEFSAGAFAFTDNLQLKLLVLYQ